MRAFEDGERVRFVGVAGLGSKWAGREGVVLDSYRDFDGNRVIVQFDGEDRGVSFDEDDFAAVKSTYEIEMAAEDSTYATMELTDTEAAVLLRLVAEFAVAHDPNRYQPTMTMKKVEK